MAINIFISYAHEDISYKEALLKRLKPLSLRAEINVWHDGEIATGAKWDDSIKQNLQQADIVILLLSADFFASDYIFKEELPTIITRRIANQLQLVPIIVRDVILEGSNIEVYQCLPLDAEKRIKPIVSWENRDEAWSQADKKIREVIKTVEKQKKILPPPKSSFKLGKHHIYTCDRVDQYDDFKLRTKGEDKIQYLYAFGQEYQSIQGFFNRIKHDKAGVLLDYLNPNAKSSNEVVSFEITFEHTKNEEIYIDNIYKSLLSKFFDNIDNRAPILAQTILKVLAESQKVNHLKGKDYLCILLTISQEDWEKEITPNVVRKVIEAFFDHPIPADKPTVLLFFGTSYEENDGQTEQEIRAAIKEGEYLKILPELEEVPHTFIKKWFKKYNAFFDLKPKQLDKLRKQYFQDDIYDMDDIETGLEELLDNYNKEQLK